MFRTIIAFSCVFGLAHSWSCSTGDNLTVMKYFSLKETNSNAVCNDGTPAGLYFKAGSNPSLWVMYLAGGDWCYDAESCDARAKLPMVGNGGYNGTYHTSSKLFADTCLKTGVFSEDSSAALATANKIFVPYCTSDAHMGDREASDATNGWHFRGATVVRSVVSYAVEHLNLGEKTSTLVFGGGSAGARGAMTHVDNIAAMVPQSVSVVGFLDSNMWLDLASYNSSFMGFGPQTQQAHDYFVTNASGVVPAECSMMYAGEEWRCIFGQYRMPFLQTPYLIVASQYDSWQLRFEVCNDLMGCDVPDAALPYVDNYGMLLQQYMIGNPPVRSSNHSAVYSQGCYNHHMSESSLFVSTTTEEGLSEQDALAQFIEMPAGYKWVDQCQGYNCGSGC